MRRPSWRGKGVAETEKAHVIRIENLSRSFRVGDSEVWALKHVNLTVDQGEFLAILGPSGSGKSTLMNVLGCMDEVQEGEYHLLNLPIREMDDAQLTRIRNRLIGFIFQKYFLVPKYTVLQNVMMPRLLLADEPTGALDTRTGAEVLDLFETLNEMGNTIVMITHDLHVAQRAHRVVRIVDGELHEDAG